MTRGGVTWRIHVALDRVQAFLWRHGSRRAGNSISTLRWWLYIAAGRKG